MPGTERAHRLARRLLTVACMFAGNCAAHAKELASGASARELAVADPIDVHGPQRWCSGGYVIPSFLVVGFQKCGTSTLVGDLRIMLQPKCFAREQHFFTDRSKAPHALSSYGRDFDVPCPELRPANLTDSRAYCFEKTPSYIRAHEPVAAIARSYGTHASELKFLVMLRNPTNRVKAWYTHFVISQKKFSNINSSVSFAARAGLGCVQACAQKLGMSLSDPELGFRCTRRMLRAGHGPVGDCTFSYGIILTGLFGTFINAFLQTFKPSSLLAISLTGYVHDPPTVRRDVMRHLFGSHAYLPPEQLHFVASSRNRKASKVEPDPARFNLDSYVTSALDNFYAPHKEFSMQVLTSLRVPCSPDPTPTMYTYFDSI